jgi:hypothetical protein
MDPEGGLESFYELMMDQVRYMPFYQELKAHLDARLTKGVVRVCQCAR